MKLLRFGTIQERQGNLVFTGFNIDGEFAPNIDIQEMVLTLAIERLNAELLKHRARFQPDAGDRK